MPTTATHPTMATIMDRLEVVTAILHHLVGLDVVVLRVNSYMRIEPAGVEIHMGDVRDVLTLGERLGGRVVCEMHGGRLWATVRAAVNGRVVTVRANPTTNDLPQALIDDLLSYGTEVPAGDDVDDRCGCGHPECGAC